MRRAALVMTVCSCATTPTPAEQQAGCQRQLDGGKTVVYREFAPPKCADARGLESIRFPITDEAAFHAAFPCATDGGVDFAAERIDGLSLSDSYFDDTLANMVEKSGRTLVLVLSPVHCGGVTPGRRLMLLVVPRGVPELWPVRCTIGRCPDRGAAPA